MQIINWSFKIVYFIGSVFYKSVHTTYNIKAACSVQIKSALIAFLYGQKTRNCI